MAGPIIGLAKMTGEYACKEIRFNANDPAYNQLYIKDCTEQEQAEAEKSRELAVEVLKSCLESFNHACQINAWKEWDKLRQGKQVYFEQTRYAILSPRRVNSVMELMNQIKFKKDVHPGNNRTFAYVCPSDKFYTIYLCAEFFRASDEMRVDCKIGTLIHEVSHFLGTTDITYKQKSALGIYSMQKSPDTGETNMRIHVDGYFGKLSQMNANNLEYEFEIMVNHVMNRCSQFDFHQGKCRACMKSVDQYSVCNRRMFMLRPATSIPEGAKDESFEIVVTEQSAILTPDPNDDWNWIKDCDDCNRNSCSLCHECLEMDRY